MKRKNKVFIPFLLLLLLISSCAEKAGKTLTILETTDIHGNILPYDFIEMKKINNSLASVFTYVKKVRSENSNTLLVDNGDNLQGQPEVYYYNFIDTASQHLLSEAMNYMAYDAVTVGNHDVETGHPVYDRIRNEYKFPMLAANAIEIKTGKPYFTPWVMINKGGIKVAVLGMITPAVPTWLPEELYSGIRFDDMVETAQKWMPEIKKEKPDLIVGMFHSGWNWKEGANTSQPGDENGSAAVALNVPGFDIILNGHDHRVACEKVVNMAGDTVLILNGGSHAEKIARADITFGKKKTEKHLRGSIIDVNDLNPDPEFAARFNKQESTVDEYVKRVIGNCPEEISSRASYFGPSAFVGLIHSLQLKITGADVSFAAPLSFDVKIAKGPVTVGDMFKLYRFENMLYTMEMTGEEIDRYLEYSYGGWMNTVKSSNDHMLRFRTDKNGGVTDNNGKAWLKFQPYNFDSAAGIEYTVDITKPEGQRIDISRFSDGRPFETGKTYKVAVNSYRGNGGGGHFQDGAGIKSDDLRKRIVTSTDKDLRYYMMKAIEQTGIIDVNSPERWKIIPEKVAAVASERDFRLLFGKGK